MATPNELEQQRQNEAAISKLKLENAGKNSVDTNEILKGTPEDLKAKGSAKLPFIVYTIGNQIKSIIQPSLDNLTKQYVEKYASQGVCLNSTELKALRQQRDLIVQQLNNIGVKIDRVGSSITGISSFLTIVINLITALDITSIAASLALKLPPVNALPVPGSVVSLIDDAQTLIRKATFDELGNSKLAKLQSSLGSSALVISIVSGYVLKSVESLKLIDNILKECDPNNPLFPINSQINTLASTQLQSSQTQNQTSYNGFIIEIEEVPYTPTVTRRRALGKNQQGIVLIQTELSFTTNNQTLINELKLIIDRDNLKAY
jgi:hypothetical protein